MPRRNRNAHALIPDTDQLADQARQLTSELCPALITCPASGSPGTLRKSWIKWTTDHPVSIVTAKAVRTDVR